MKSSFPSRLARPLLVVVAITPFAVACSGPASTDAGDVIVVDGDRPLDAFDVSFPDAAPDASDAIDVADAAAEAGEEAGADANDASVDAADASDGGGTVSFSAMVQMPAVFQNCMPSVPMDPVHAMGTVDIFNDGTVTIGPITSTTGSIVTESGASIATFTIPMLTIPAIAPGTHGTAMFTKDNDSLMPANGCSTLMCNQPVRLSIDLGGPNVPSGAHATSAISMVECAF